MPLRIAGAPKEWPRKRTQRSEAAIRAAAEALTVAMKRSGATPEAVVLELKRIARATGGFDYPREMVAIAMQEAIAVYFRPKP